MTPTRLYSSLPGFVLFSFSACAVSSQSSSAFVLRNELRIERNVGQFDGDADYIARLNGARLELRATDFSLPGLEQDLHVRFVGARTEARSNASQQLSGTTSYYRGANPRDWRLNVPAYAQVRYRGVYEGIDVVYRSAEGGFEYDLVVAPGVNPKSVQIAYEGAGALSLDAAGALVAKLRSGAFVQHRPVAYQQIGARREQVEVRYIIDAEYSVRFEVGPYDTSKPLIIDPLAYSTAITHDNNGTANHIAVDASGNVFVAAQYNRGDVINAPIDAIVQQVNPDGTMGWSDVFQGNGNTQASGIAVDSSGNVYVVGTTTSSDLPTTNAYSTACGLNSGVCKDNSDAFIAKIDPSNTILYFSYFGGPFPDTGNAIAVDAQGFAYITGAASQTQFPGVGPSHSAHTGGTRCPFDAYLAKFDMTKSGTASLVFATLIGGDGNDQGNALAIAPGAIRVVPACTHFPCPFTSTGTIYVAGTTGVGGCTAGPNGVGSPNSALLTPFPTTPNTFSVDQGVGQQAFLVLLDTSGTRYLYATVLSTKDALGVAVAPSMRTGRVNPFIAGYSDAVITGTTDGFGANTTGSFQSAPQANLDAYVADFDPTRQGQNSLVYFTFLGGSGDDHGNDVATDSSGNIVVVGSTSSTNFPIPRTLAPLRAVQPSHASCPPNGTNCLDAFMASLSRNGKAEGYATYLGGSGDDWASGVAVCKAGPCAGSVFIAGTTASSDFPFTIGSYSPGPDGFVAQITVPPSVIKKPVHPRIH